MQLILNIIIYIFKKKLNLQMKFAVIAALAVAAEARHHHHHTNEFVSTYADQMAELEAMSDSQLVSSL